MGASSSVNKQHKGSPKKSQNRPTLAKRQSPTADTRHPSSPTRTKKSTEKDAQRHISKNKGQRSRHPSASRNDKAQQRKEERLNASAPVVSENARRSSPSSGKHRTRRHTSFLPYDIPVSTYGTFGSEGGERDRQGEGGSETAEQRPATAPPVVEPADSSVDASEVFDATLLDSAGSPEPEGVLYRAPELELENFRRLVTKVNMKADQAASRRKLKATATPTRGAALGGRSSGATGFTLEKNGEKIDMEWLEANIPYVSQSRRVSVDSGRSSRMEYSYAGMMLSDHAQTPESAKRRGSRRRGKEREGTEDGGAGYFRSPASTSSLDSASSATATTTTTERRGGSQLANVYSYVNAVRQTRNADAVEEVGNGKAFSRAGSLNRQATFGYCAPHNKSVVIRRNQLDSFQLLQNRRPSLEELPADESEPGIDAFFDSFLRREEERADVTVPVEGQAAEAAEEGIARVQKETEAATMPAPALPPIVTKTKAGTVAVSRRNRRTACPEPQPFMYGPRTSLGRSRYFDVRTVLGFQPELVRRVPSPDWRQLERREASPSPPRVANSRGSPRVIIMPPQLNAVQHQQRVAAYHQHARLQH